MSSMKNIQIIDGAANATFSVFQATDDQFAVIFPSPQQDIEIVEDFLERAGDRANEILEALWTRPILRRDALGIHGVLFYGWADRRAYLPATKREVDLDPLYINAAQRELFDRKR